MDKISCFRATGGPYASRGFTLLDLMLTTAVLSIVAGVGIPSMQGTLENARSTSAGNELVLGMRLAKAEAVKRNEAMTVCQSEDGLICKQYGAEWRRWIVVPYQDRRGGKPLMSVELPSTFRFVIDDHHEAGITFHPNGRLSKNIFNGFPATAVLCGGRNDEKKLEVRVGVGGHANASKKSGTAACQR